MWISVTLLVLLNLELTAAQTGDCFPYIEYQDQGPLGARRLKARTLEECRTYCEDSESCRSFHYAESGKRRMCWAHSDPKKAFRRKDRNPMLGFITYEFQCRIPNLGKPYVVTADMEVAAGGDTSTGVTNLAECHETCVNEPTCGAWLWEAADASPCSYYTGLPSSGSVSMTASTGVLFFDLRSEEEGICVGETVKIACPAGNGVTVSSATYGRSASSSLCPATNPATDCFADVTTEVGALCDGLAECSVHNADSLSGVTDPCPTTTGEILLINYVCQSIPFPGHSLTHPTLPAFTSILSGYRAYPDLQGTGGIRQDAIVDDPAECLNACDGDGTCLAAEYNRVTGKCFHYYVDAVCNSLMPEPSYYHVKKPGVDCASDPSYVGAAYVEP